MKLALRTRILQTDMPLISSFMDVFCHQYGCIDYMSAKAWRAVWEEWGKLDGSTAPSSPCELDFLLYRVGREYCKNNLVEYRCEHGHRFFWFGAGLRRCIVCRKSDRGQTTPIKRMIPCQVDAAELPRKEDLLLVGEGNLLRFLDGTCIFEGACEPKCKGFRVLDPPKSISIKGQTSWTNSMADRDRGGGGMMG